MAARRHLCCFIDDETNEGCDEIATNALGYYSDSPSIYACREHVGWLPHQWNGRDPLYYRLIDGFDPMLDSNEDIRAARATLVRNGVIRIG